MAMQHSNELPEAATILFQQMQTLSMPAWSAGYCIWDDDKNAITLWMSSEGVLQPPFKAPTTQDELFIQMRKGYEQNKALHVVEMGDEKLVAHYKYMRTLPVVGEILDSIIEAGHPLPTFQIMHYAYFSKGFLLFITYEPVPDAHNIFKRFASVFDQTYTRFLDLQKAEAQAREAQIEAALERVRSKTMAMHNSNDVGETVTTMFAEFVHLGIQTNRCGILIIDDKERAEVWTARSNPEGKANLIIGKLNLAKHNMLSSVYKAWNAKENFYQYILMGDDLISYYDAINKSEYYPVKFDLNALPSKEFHSDFFFPEGAVFAFTREIIPEEHSKIFKRFSGVFGQTYRRYLDLQKAEAQAREAQIEAALERVRARTMAMQKSSELNPTADLLFDQLKLLGADLQGVAFAICDKDSDIVQKWTSIGVFSFPYTIEPAEQNMYEAWKNQVPLYEEVFEGERIKKYYKTLMEVPAFKQGLQKLLDTGIPMPAWQKNHAVSFQQGYLLIISTKPFSETQIFVRFGKVFEQTYTRFLDLQKAEA
ncbi:MAG: hypothetical protein JSR71_12460, partial [Proteobacteria bacterium]|nr:hypothetical protein [Pseudomonadota bacterium]